MRVMGKIAPTIAALLLGSATGAAAADLCLDSNGGLNTLALKAFSLPARGACVDYRGFYIDGPFWVRGTACGSSDNVTVTFFDTGFLDGGDNRLISERFSLSRSTLTGTGTACIVSTLASGQCAPETFQKVACNPSVVPIPEQ